MSKKYLTKVVGEIKSNFETRDNTNDVKFYLNCINEFINSGKKEFSYEFEEFGMTFTNQYPLNDIINFLFYYKSEKAIISFEENQTQNEFDNLVDAFSWLNLSFISAQNDEVKQSGEFFQDIVFSCLFAYCFYPSSLKQTLNYLNNYYDQESINWSVEDFKNNYGYSDVLQLLQFILNREGIAYNLKLKEQELINSEYDFVIKNLLDKDEKVFSEIISKLSKFHINNKGKSYLDTFNHDAWKYFPLELIAISKFRAKNNLSNTINSDLINKFIPFIDLAKCPSEVTTLDLDSKLIK
ncbi:hypothetical protein [Flavobacterium aestivum]|uniref:hypothetical protein n=1 Tax=Flavobacterium aestivum TaxID=3003257 RepID=UPI0022862CC6|nr:hypothetical protein [Flavobacterium aestivum]